MWSPRLEGFTFTRYHLSPGNTWPAGEWWLQKLSFGKGGNLSLKKKASWTDLPVSEDCHERFYLEWQCFAEDFEPNRNLGINRYGKFQSPIKYSSKPHFEFAMRLPPEGSLPGLRGFGEKGAFKTSFKNFTRRDFLFHFIIILKKNITM